MSRTAIVIVIQHLHKYNISDIFFVKWVSCPEDGGELQAFADEMAKIIHFALSTRKWDEIA
jgi:hypothetical protein